MLVYSNAAAQGVLTLVLPTSLIIFVHRSAASFELHHKPFNWVSKSPNGDLPALIFIILGIVSGLHPSASSFSPASFPQPASQLTPRSTSYSGPSSP